MLVKNMQIDAPITIRIGDTVFKLMKIGERSVKIGIDAPRHITIDFEAGEDPALIKEAVENAINPVLKP